jgi:glycosyltransferase involved in cell wall biosynthesis
MRLLFVTQKADEQDELFGFTHRWIEEFAAHWEQVTVICLYEGTHRFPPNVRVLSLGKEAGASRLKYLWRFYRYILSAQYDRVLVHMNPEYLVLGGWLWRLRGTRAGLWYSHKSNNLKLRIAVFFAQVVFSTAKKSVTFESPKLRIMGHGIDVDSYRCSARPANAVPVVLTVGRVTKIKHCETLIEAVSLLKAHGFTARGVIAGGPVNDADRAYEAGLRAQVTQLGVGGEVEFTGLIPVEELRAWYCRADISVNMVPTGGLDKSVLEGMAAGNLVMSSNEVFRDYFGPYGERLLFKTGDAKGLADHIESLWKSPDREEVRAFLGRAVGQFDVRSLVSRLSDELKRA